MKISFSFHHRKARGVEYFIFVWLRKKMCRSGKGGKKQNGSDDDGNCYGIVWIKAGQWSFIPSPAQKKSWNKPVLLDTGSDILVISGEDKKAWWVSSPEQKPCEVVSENLCAALGQATHPCVYK